MTEHGLTIRGRADRLDYHAASDTWRIIDYKTWDRLGKNDGADRFMSASKADLEAAAQRGLAPFAFADKPRVWTDLQLPLYLLMAQAGALVPAGAKTECGYFVLGETEAETVCKAWDFAPLRDDAVAAVRWVIGRVKAGVYWIWASAPSGSRTKSGDWPGTGVSPLPGTADRLARQLSRVDTLLEVRHEKQPDQGLRRHRQDLRARDAHDPTDAPRR
jgi:hypothetical protein